MEFRDQNFAEQAQSIFGAINDLPAEIERHIDRSPRPQETIEECLALVDRLPRRLGASNEQARGVTGGPEPGVAGEEIYRFHVSSPRLAVPQRAADFTLDVREEL